MKKLLVLLPVIFLAVVLKAQQPVQAGLSFKIEELTSPKFVKAVELSGGVCVIPLGIIEKHGPHLPLGADLYESREVAFHAAEKEYAVIFPPYFVGQIFEAKHQPGAIAYSNELILKNESGLDQDKLSKLPFGYTGIWWYAKYPNHFASDVNQPNKRLGELLITSDANQLAELIKFLKKNNTIEQLQEEFFKKAQNPIQK